MVNFIIDIYKYNKDLHLVIYYHLNIQLCILNNFIFRYKYLNILYFFFPTGNSYKAISSGAFILNNFIKKYFKKKKIIIIKKLLKFYNVYFFINIEAKYLNFLNIK